MRLLALLLRSGWLLPLALTVVAAGCGDDAGSPGGDDDDDDMSMVGDDDDDTGNPAGGAQLGDGSPDSMVLTTIWSSPTPREATDLDFDPQTGQLWATLREYFDSNLSCTQANRAPDLRNPGCAQLWGSTVAITDPGGDEPVGEWMQDTNAWHFMRRPSAIAFGIPDQRSAATPEVSTWFATCHEWNTGNFDDDPTDFIGPTHWTSDPVVYPDWAVTSDPEANGSHLDMLHASPFCVGIAHERDAIYWVFNGNVGSIDMYDFADPHPDRTIGGADHSDGTIYRYAQGEFMWEPNVMSHVDFGPEARWLYIADSGNGRVARLDITSGTEGARFAPAYDQLRISNFVDGAVVETVVPPGTLDTPSGLDVADGELFVTDNATSIIYAFSLEGELLNQFDTGLPTDSLGGLVVGPDDKVYLVNRLTADIYRLDPAN
ncbi:MAG TPA: hypothetical protein RMF84_10480 [Polyangiaceae bacterium LLY-WYZ-14_1]|nr:hypothetical protein [Polyangiaceae bacterium LLY-WYZ-14_1]